MKSACRTSVEFSSSELFYSRVSAMTAAFIMRSDSRYISYKLKAVI